MGMTAELKGREALMNRLNQLAPNIEKYAADAKLKAAEELAEAISQRAPAGATLEYMESFEGAPLSSRPVQEQVGTTKTKDPSAAGVFAEFIWRFLEFGTAPHNVAKGGGTKAGMKQLAAGGGIQHPGSRAQPHIFPTYRAMKPKIRKMILAAVNKGIRDTRHSKG